jgi:guanine nucleotide-binding protein alpha-1 subunit
MAKGVTHPNNASGEDRQDDPLAKVLQPPPNESPEERVRREQQQREATRVSLQIDEGIQEAKKAYDRRKRAVKVLLLGASFCPSCML